MKKSLLFLREDGSADSNLLAIKTIISDVKVLVTVIFEKPDPRYHFTYIIIKYPCYILSRSR